MNGTSGFQEMRSSSSRSSTNRFLHEQRHRFGTGIWHLLRTHDLIAFSTDITVKKEYLASRLGSEAGNFYVYQNGSRRCAFHFLGGGESL
jgi:hypothetical protein